MRATLESRLETLALFIREQVHAASERGEHALTDAELVEIERARCLLKAVRVCPDVIPERTQIEFLSLADMMLSPIVNRLRGRLH